VTFYTENREQEKRRKESAESEKRRPSFVNAFREVFQAFRLQHAYPVFTAGMVLTAGGLLSSYTSLTKVSKLKGTCVLIAAIVMPILAGSSRKAIVTRAPPYALL
jgi:hypothetical protein